MARLEAVSKLLYYPTPPQVTEAICTYFADQSEFIRLVDPCCGTGEALASIAATFTNRETFGVELSQSRADTASTVLDRVIPTSFYYMTESKFSRLSCSLVYDNPPYDWSEFKERSVTVRHENRFVELSTPKLVPGGCQVIVVPAYILNGDATLVGKPFVDRLARHLVSWYESITVFRFPDELYQSYKQIVIFAASKRALYHHPSTEEVEALQFIEPAVLKPNDGPPITLPASPRNGVKFIHQPATIAELQTIAKRANPLGTDEWYRATHVKPLGAPFTPATSLSLGHTTMLIMGQQTGIVTIGDTLMKGMSRKELVKEAEERVSDDGKHTFYAVIEVERHVSTIATASSAGLSIFSTPIEVGGFITENAETIAESLLTKNQPLYSWDPTDEEWSTSGLSALGLPPLPGRKERGLFVPQRHFAIAAVRVMRRWLHCILNAEMGFGKTATAVAAAEILNEWPALVVCPGHMVWKWFRDIALSSNPSEPITPRVITRPCLDNSGRTWPYVREALESFGTLLSTRRYQLAPTSKVDPGGRRVVVMRCPHGLGSLGFVSSVKGIPPTVKLLGPQVYEITFVDRDDYTLFDFHADYSAGLLGKKAIAISSTEPAKWDAGRNPKSVIRYRKEKDPHFGTMLSVATCPTCGADLEGDRSFCSKCGGALFNFNRWHRVGLARLVQKKFRHFFKLYVADEIHKSQGGRTDIGVMDQRILSGIRYSLSLTGTLFGGTASSLFYLLYRRVPELRRLYSFTDQIRWVEHFGLFERSWNQRNPVVTSTGKSTGIERWSFNQKEVPGIAPGVINYLLPITLFGNITDLGYELPALHEHIVQLELPLSVQEIYDNRSEWLLHKALENYREYRDIGGLSVWFSFCRYWPVSAFRTEEYAYKDRFSTVVPGVKEVLPKEMELARIIQANRLQGRRTLVFVEQTGTRDVREHLIDSMKKLAPGVIVEQLSANSMAPARREAWIKTSSMDVLLVNPRLVETGLDLVMFSDIVFYETSVSLYTLWQSMRRVWRLGQKNIVHVTFLAYNGTVEDAILQRMGLKMKAAQLLYGKDAAGCLVETDAMDVQRELIAAALEGKHISSAPPVGVFTDGTAQELHITSALDGSPIASSPMVFTDTDTPVIVWDLSLIPRRKRKPKPIPPGQLQLF